MSAQGNKVFAPAIFFIAAREALEASLVIGILSGMLENLVMHTKSAEDEAAEDSLTDEEKEQALAKKKAIVRKLRKIVSTKVPLIFSTSWSTILICSCMHTNPFVSRRYCWVQQRVSSLLS